MREFIIPGLQIALATLVQLLHTGFLHWGLIKWTFGSFFDRKVSDRKSERKKIFLHGCMCGDFFILLALYKTAYFIMYCCIEMSVVGSAWNNKYNVSASVASMLILNSCLPWTTKVLHKVCDWSLMQLVRCCRL